MNLFQCIMLQLSCRIMFLLLILTLIMTTVTIKIILLKHYLSWCALITIPPMVKYANFIIVPTHCIVHFSYAQISGQRLFEVSVNFLNVGLVYFMTLHSETPYQWSAVRLTPSAVRQWSTYSVSPQSNAILILLLLHGNKSCINIWFSLIYSHFTEDFKILLWWLMNEFFIRRSDKSIYFGYGQV